MNKVLVLTLYYGENEYVTCKSSVKGQVGVDVDHFCIEWLSNKNAHDKLYATIMEKSDKYDYFIKLDADMVFSSALSVSRILEIIEYWDELDVLSLPVFDFFTGKNIWGVNIFSKRCQWKSNSNPLFVDYLPQYPGKRKSVELEGGSVVLHAPDPSEYQAFMFGVHRAMKIIQKDSARLELGNAFAQIRILNSVAINAFNKNSKQSMLALLGADSLMHGVIGAGVCFQKTDFENIYNEIKKKNERNSNNNLLSLVKNWRNKRYIIWLTIINVGVLRLLFAACRKFKDRFKN